MKKATFFSLGLTVAVLIAVPADLQAQKRTSLASSNYVIGRVTTGGGSNPARSVWVILYDGATEKGRSLTGDDGRYYIGNLEQKPYAIVVRRQITGTDLVRNQISLPSNRVYNIRLP
jgi:hypothetical protein